MMTRSRAWMFDNMQAILVPCMLGAISFSGCGLRGNSELLEAQLRKQETVIRRYESETSRLKEELALSQREMDLMRSAQTGPALQEEATRNLAKVQGLVFNTLLTGGQDQDSVAGDERFHAVFYPHDADGEVVKLAGKLEVEAIDLSRPTNEKSLGRWEYTPDEARQLWLAGFLTSGFQVEESWKTVPAGAKVLLYAKLTTADGRTFEATHTIPVERTSVAATPPGALPSSPTATRLIEQSNFETTAENRPVPNPLSWEHETPATPPSPSTASPSTPVATAPKEAQQRSAAASPREAKPFPAAGGVQTSDNWTDETTPLIR